MASDYYPGRCRYRTVPSLEEVLLDSAGLEEFELFAVLFKKAEDYIRRSWNLIIGRDPEDHLESPPPSCTLSALKMCL